MGILDFLGCFKGCLDFWLCLSASLLEDFSWRPFTHYFSPSSLPDPSPAFSLACDSPLLSLIWRAPCSRGRHRVYNRSWSLLLLEAPVDVQWAQHYSTFYNRGEMCASHPLSFQTRLEFPVTAKAGREVSSGVRLYILPSWRGVFVFYIKDFIYYF